MGRRSRERDRERAGRRRGAKLAELVGHLTAGEACRVSADEAAAIAEALHGELDEGTGARAQVAGERGMEIACRRGCAACCEEPVLAYLPEALRVARWLERPENATARAAFSSGLSRWRAALGDAPERLADLAEHEADRERYEALHRETWRRGVPCAFLVDGTCAVYEVRPLVCRNAHAIDTADRCAASSPVPAVRLTFGPVDQFLGRAAWLIRQAHDVMATERSGARVGRSEALCDLVGRLLAI